MVKLSDFTFGTETENFVETWRCDHEDTHETVSRKFDNFNGVLVFVRNIVERHMTDDTYIAHSWPDDKSSSASQHIHFKANIPNWQEYKYPLYLRMHSLIKLFQIYFKNSPNKDGVFSKRHFRDGNHWCKLTKLERERFGNGSRHYTAITPNPAFDTLEFRYNEVPKHLNQMAMFYYLLNIAINDDIEIPELPDEQEISTFNDLKSPICAMFSYKDKESIKNYNKTYIKILGDFVDDVDKKLKNKFYDFNKKKYTSFRRFCMDTLEQDLKEFKDYFDGKEDDYSWSSKHKKSFKIKIKRVLIS